MAKFLRNIGIGMKYINRSTLMMKSCNRSSLYFLTKNQSTNSTTNYKETYLDNLMKEVSSPVYCDAIEMNEEENENYELEDFFVQRCINYEEYDKYILSNCPVCKDENGMTIEKLTGNAVCSSCSWVANWDQLSSKCDEILDSLTDKQLFYVMDSLISLEKNHLDRLQSTAFSKFGFEILKKAGAHLSSDESQLIFPIYNEKYNNIGYASFSLFHPGSKVVYRLMKGCSGIFTYPVKNSGTFHIVPSIADVISLALLDKKAICYPPGINMTTLYWSLARANCVYVWNDLLAAKSTLSDYLYQSKSLKIFLVRPKSDLQINAMKKIDVERMFESAAPMSSGSNIESLKDVETSLIDIIKNKKKENGVMWNRFKDLNFLMAGHRRGELTIITGLSGTGKTTLMAEYSLDLCMQGVSTLWGSFEINRLRLLRIMLQQYYGNQLPEDDDELKFIIQKFNYLPLCVLNMQGQQPLTDVISSMTEAVCFKGVSHIIIDNLQFMMGTNVNHNNWWLEQDKAIGIFRKFSTEFNCHISLIIHPKKMESGQKILGMSDISGGARVTQEADNVLILQIKDNDNNTGGRKYLQVCKNRYAGTLGEFRLRFHKESLTFSSHFFQLNQKPF